MHNPKGNKNLMPPFKIPVSKSIRSLSLIKSRHKDHPLVSLKIDVPLGS